MYICIYIYVSSIFILSLKFAETTKIGMVWNHLKFHDPPILRFMEDDIRICLVAIWQFAMIRITLFLLVLSKKMIQNNYPQQSLMISPFPSIPIPIPCESPASCSLIFSSDHMGHGWSLHADLVTNGELSNSPVCSWFYGITRKDLGLPIHL